MKVVKNRAMMLRPHFMGMAWKLVSVDGWGVRDREVFMPYLVSGVEGCWVWVVTGASSGPGEAVATRRCVAVTLWKEPRASSDTLAVRSASPGSGALPLFLLRILTSIFPILCWSQQSHTTLVKPPINMRMGKYHSAL